MNQFLCAAHLSSIRGQDYRYSCIGGDATSVYMQRTVYAAGGDYFQQNLGLSG
jgi:hypothetical protein